MSMKALFVLLALCGVVVAELEERTIELRLDHFNPLDRRTFDDRYLANSEHFTAGGPIFIYVGGTERSEQFLQQGAVWEIARDTRGILFTLEHRFFRESRPTENTSVENLQFLTINQVLGDLAQFINFIRANYYGAQNSRVILWGRGYGGSLAVWARQKYPHLVDGVWASSAPINAVLEYPEAMSNTFATINSIGGDECGQVLTEAFRIIEDSIRLGNTSFVEERLNLCNPIENIDEEFSMLFYGIASDVAYTFLSNARYPEIDEKCRIMRGLDNPTSQPENALDAFARWFVDDYRSDSGCLDYSFENLVNEYSNIEWDSISNTLGTRQKTWIQCTQLGQFGVSNNGENHPFGWRFDSNFFRQWCGRIFGENLLTPDFIDQSISRTNEYFGGLNPHVYRVFFTHGEMDPQRNLGPNEDLNVNSPVKVMSLQSAGRDFGSPSETDYVVLQQTKERARELIIKWIIDSAIEEPTPTPVPEETTTSGPVPAHDRQPARNFQ